MKSSPGLPLTLAVVILAACTLSCARDNAIQTTQAEMPQAERLRAEKAVNEFHSRMNAGEYGQIWEGGFSDFLGSKEGFSKYLDWIHQKYGSVTQANLVKGEVRPFIDDPRKRVVDCWFEIQAERGRYMERIIWHFVGDEDKFAQHVLVQYDEQGRPYLTQTLSTGTYRILLDGAEPSDK
jgi:hypothetical protein